MVNPFLPGFPTLGNQRSTPTALVPAMPQSLRRRLLALGLLLTMAITTTHVANAAEDSDLPDVTSGMTIGSGTLTDVTEEKTPTGSYKSYATKVSLTPASISTSEASANGTGHAASDSQNASTSASITYLTGTHTPSTTEGAGNITATTKTSPAPSASNTTPCNNHVGFCGRKYGNITEVGAHNSPFTRPASAASNQELDVTTQLDDGIRFLQAQMQWPANDTVPHFCHTSCDILDAGPITDWLGQVKSWVDSHPFDVVTILLGNGNYSKAEMYAPHIEETGITRYVYTPPHLPMALDDWPTLENMIINGKRVVMMMDYETQPEEYPWLMDEFSVMWETPFDPIDRSFPCTVQRPPNLSNEDARNRMYLTNHNFNVEVNAFGATILVPATSILNETNAVSGEGSLGEGAQTCLEDWDRPPTFLNVDYYNKGDYPGSVFEVAATMNGVVYDRNCCGDVASTALGLSNAVPSLTVMLGAAVLITLLIDS